MKPVYATFLVVFWPSKFVEKAVLHDVALEFDTNPQLRDKFPDRRLPPDRLQDFRATASERSQKIRRALFASILVTTAIIVVGWIIGVIFRRVFGPAPTFIISVLQVTGAGTILGATLAEIGRDIESWGGKTLAEKVNLWLFRTLYLLGTFVFVVSLGWGS